VEDDSPSRRLLVAALAPAYEVRAAGSAEEALTLVEEATPAAVVTNVGLPGMDGLDLVRALRERPATRACPIVVVSGMSLGDEAIGAGADGFLEKPYRPTELVRILGRLVG
jgi:CheY-like chemotaxis protein